MMKRITLLLTLVCLLLPLAPNGAGAEIRAEAISIPDPVLESAIRLALNRPDGPLTPEDAARLTELDVSRLYESLALKLLPPGESLDAYTGETVGITSLEGLQHFTNLEKLAINYDYHLFHIRHEVRQLTPLRALHKLTELSLAGQPLTSLEGIESLTNLRQLNLAATGLQDLRPLRGLSSLEELDLSSNMLRDLTGLESLTNLRSLSLYSNPLNDLSALAPLKQLESLSAGGLTTMWDDRDLPPLSLEPLRGLTVLKRLDLSLARVEDIRPLAPLISLEMLDLSQNPGIGEIGPLASMKELKQLRLTNTGISDLAPLRNAGKLETLDVAINDLTTLDALRGMDRLVSLYADSNRLTAIDAVNELPSLEQASFIRNSIIDISGLRPSDKLRYLNIEQTFVDYRETSASGITIRRLRESDVDVRYTAYDPFPDILFRDDQVYAFGRMVAASGLPFLEKGRTYVPLRFVSEVLGANVTWDGGTRKITIRQEDRIIELTVGEPSIVVNGVEKPVDAAPTIVDGLTYVPVRFVSEQLGLYVQALPAIGVSLTRMP